MPKQKRTCEKCGAVLADEDVIKIKNEDGKWQTIPLPLCPDCFANQMRRRANGGRQDHKLC